MFSPVMVQRDHLCLVSSLNVRWRAVVHVAFASGPGGCCGGQSPQGIKQLKANRGCRRLFQAHLTGRTVGRQEGACIRSIPMKRQERTIIRAVDRKKGACIRSIPRKRQERTCIRNIPMKRQERTIIRAVDGKKGACIRSIPRKRQERTWRATGGSRGLHLRSFRDHHRHNRHNHHNRAIGGGGSTFRPLKNIRIRNMNYLN